MTSYGYDTTTRRLVAMWESGLGATACEVACLHERTPERAGLHLARMLTSLSTVAWMTYTDPHVLELRAGEVLRAVWRPNLPEGDLLYREGDHVLESAHEAGRALAAVGSAGVRRAVLADVEEEVDAVDRASRGELSGRARQAVSLTRFDASPLQVAAADRLLHEVPLGSPRLFSEVEPTAAAVAAMHWLAAAADVTAALHRWEPVQVIEEAALVDDLDPTIPRIVLALMAEGNAPLAIALNLVRSAMLAARGMVLATPGARETDEEVGFTALEPGRPGPSLLEGVVRGIHGCFAVYLERVDPTVVEAAPEGPGWAAAVRRHFDAAVRAEAARTAERIA